jgi:dUTP pyrophosphatase
VKKGSVEPKARESENKPDAAASSSKDRPVDKVPDKGAVAPTGKVRKKQYNSQVPPGISTAQWNNFGAPRKLAELNAYNRSVGLPECTRLFTRDELDHLHYCAEVHAGSDSESESDDDGSTEGEARAIVGQPIREAPGEMKFSLPLLPPPDAPPSENVVQMLRTSSSATMPVQAYPGDAGYDLFANQGVLIPSQGRFAVLTGIRLRPPNGMYARLASKAGLARDRRIRVGGGAIDPKYREELDVDLFNSGKEDFHVKIGVKIAQLIFEKFETPTVQEVQILDETEGEENGFGNTGETRLSTPIRHAEVESSSMQAEPSTIFTATVPDDDDESDSSKFPQTANSYCKSYAAAVRCIPVMPTYVNWEDDPNDMGEMEHPSLRMEAFVARSVGKKEIQETQKAADACIK